MRKSTSNGGGHAVKIQGQKDDGRTLSWNNLHYNWLPSSCLRSISPVNWPTPEYGSSPSWVWRLLVTLFP